MTCFVYPSNLPLKIQQYLDAIFSGEGDADSVLETLLTYAVRYCQPIPIANYHVNSTSILYVGWDAPGIHFTIVLLIS